MEIEVMTYNIRYATVNDGENQWENRKIRVAKLINDELPELFGLQEALYEQLTFLDQQLPQYQYYGVGRDDGKMAGEYSPIFWLKKEFQLMDSGQFWLSQTPEIPSKGWEANFHRIVTWVELKHLASSTTFRYYNTHFDHEAELARKNSSLMILDTIAKYASELPIILSGDFNSGLGDEPFQLLHDSPLLFDSFQEYTGVPDGTFAGGFSVDQLNHKRIDHIFYTQQLTAIEYKIIETSENGFFPSDHLPVTSRLITK